MIRFYDWLQNVICSIHLTFSQPNQHLQVLRWYRHLLHHLPRRVRAHRSRSHVHHLAEHWQVSIIDFSVITVVSLVTVTSTFAERKSTWRRSNRQASGSTRCEWIAGEESIDKETFTVWSSQKSIIYRTQFYSMIDIKWIMYHVYSTIGLKNYMLPYSVPPQRVSSRELSSSSRRALQWESMSCLMICTRAIRYGKKNRNLELGLHYVFTCYPVPSLWRCFMKYILSFVLYCGGEVVSILIIKI